MRKYMSKRQRPCDYCRSRKTACRIDHSPPCRACLLGHRECTFVLEAPPRRRPQTHDIAGSDPSAHDGTESPEQEGTLTARSPYDFFSGQLPDNDDDAVRQMAYDASTGLLPWLNMDLDVSDYPFMSNLSPAETQQAQLSARADQSAAGEPLLQTLDRADDACPQVIGLSSDMDPHLLNKYNTDEYGFFHFKQLSIHSVQTQPYPVQFLTSSSTLFAQSRQDAGHSEAVGLHLRDTLEGLIPESTGKRLIALFRKFIGPQYPIFSNEALPETSSSPVHLLAATYAVAFPFSMYDDQLCIELAYDTPPYSDLSRLINVSLWPELHSPTITAVQTLILLVIRPVSNPLVAEAPYKWSLMSTLASISVTLGLHLDPGSWKLPLWQTALRRRLSFTTYALDKWMGASLGRPRHLQDDDWLVTSLEILDKTGADLDDEAWNDIACSAALTSILNFALSRLYSLRASQDIARNPQNGFAIASELLHSLPTIKNADATEHDRYGTIQLLGYHYVRLLIIRSVTRPFIDTDLINHAPNLSVSDEFGLDFRKHLRACVDDFLDFIQRIKTDSAQQFWPPWCSSAISTLCFALLSAAVSSATEDEASQWLGLLQRTRRELRMKASTLHILRIGLLRIDSIFWRGLDKVLRLEPHVQTAVRKALAT